ncbi:unnamed protein product [Prorocentrum cordatum]|uniref:Trafficking protein particle complex 8 n=1 Tax=Prorocentrum cordatum TaxID=2364126 RepID=A0ABN9S9K5_9DINO|nr:unnamed protein product [Polarella glacialis]
MGSAPSKAAVPAVGPADVFAQDVGRLVQHKARAQQRVPSKPVNHGGGLRARGQSSRVNKDDDSGLADDAGGPRAPRLDRHERAELRRRDPRAVPQGVRERKPSLDDRRCPSRRAPPDPKGVQFAAIKQYLTKRDEVKYLWLDWPCMWQANKEGQREITVDEKAEFDLMLSEVNMLYLGCRVVILLDMTYLSRFWTLYEAWLSQMKPTSTGLKPALISDASRCDVVPIMGANDAFRSALLSTIANQMSSASLAAKYLRNDDILVTNASDKEKQLDRVSGLDYRVIQVEIDAQAEAGSTVQMQRVLAAGYGHSLGLLKDGTVTACGRHGHRLRLMTLTDGTVTACGDDSEGQTSGVAQWRDVAQIAAGYKHSLGLLKDGTFTACGCNGRGQAPGK